MQTLTDYLSALQNKRVAVVGIGISNTPLIHRLCAAGLDVTACDRKEASELGALADALRREGVTLHLGTDYLDHLDHDIIFRSPGIRPDVPAFVAAQERGSVLSSEMEVFFELCPCRIIGVTGSDGKTTTTTIISECLKNAGYTVHVGGNIGNPLLAEVEKIQADDFVVLELSSFQLMTMQKSPHIALVTNLSPNHLDVHRSMEEYRLAKEAIFCHQTPDDLAIFNHDNEETRTMCQKAVGKTRCFSRTEYLERGVFVRDGFLCVRDEQGERVLFPRSSILLPGEHNVENYLAAISAVLDFVPVEIIEQTAKEFRGVAHRIELVRTVDGVRYYNDSIASSPTRSIAGLRAFTQKVLLIAGGYDKKIPFEALGEEICRTVKTVFLNGLTADKIRTAIASAPSYREGAPKIVMAADFKDALARAREAAIEGDVVLLSPACASFDQFPNFAARGDAFKTWVNGLQEEGTLEH